MKELGNFICESGILRISDPCYDLKVWCAGQLENCKKGTWKAIANYQEDDIFYNVNYELEGGLPFKTYRVSSLICYHSDINFDNIIFDNKADFTVGVDSGQSGIFCLNHYQDNSIVPEDFKFEYNGYYRKEFFKDKITGEYDHFSLIMKYYEQKDPITGFDNFIDMNDVKFISKPCIEKWICSDNHEKWYDMCCSKTLDRETLGGVIPFGAVSSTGYGDGSYECTYQKINNEIVAIKINYLEYDEEDEDD